MNIPPKPVSDPNEMEAANARLRAKYPKAVAVMQTWRVNLDSDPLSAHRFLLCWDDMAQAFATASNLRTWVIRIPFVALMDDDRRPLHFYRRFKRRDLLQ